MGPRDKSESGTGDPSGGALPTMREDYTSGGARPTVRAVLELEALRGAEVVGGVGGLDREVTGANIVEVPEVSRWLKGGEFLLTAGYAWRDEPQGLVTILEDLDRCGISALAIKPGRYLSEIPDALSSKADELGLPLIEIPPSVAYRDVIELLYRRLMSQRLWVLERSSQVLEVFTSLGLEYQSIEKVAVALADVTASPVYVVDMLDDSVVVARPGGSPTRAAPENLDVEDARIARQLTELTPRRVPTKTSLGRTSALASSLVVGRQPVGRIAVVESGAPLDEFVERAVAHGAELISFLLMRQMAIIQGRREAGGLFFESLMSDDLSNEEAAERALTLGLRLTRRCTALAIGVTGYSEEQAGILRACCERALSPWPHVMGKGHGGADVGVLVEVPDDFTVEDLEAIVKRVEGLVTGGGLRGMLFGSGSARKGLEGVRRSRSEARIAYEVGRRMNKTGLVRFEDLSVERLLAQIPSTPLSHDYIDMTVGPLEEEPELMRTLEIFLEHGGNKVATASAIPLHRSSLEYRLEKISKLLDIDSLGDPERRLELWLALRLRRIFRISKPE